MQTSQQLLIKLLAETEAKGGVINTEDMRVAISKFYRACRKDLHIDPISQEIQKSFYPAKTQNILGKKDDKKQS